MRHRETNDSCGPGKCDRSKDSSIETTVGVTTGTGGVLRTPHGVSVRTGRLGSLARRIGARSPDTYMGLPGCGRNVAVTICVLTLPLPSRRHRRDWTMSVSGAACPPACALTTRANTHNRSVQKPRRVQGVNALESFTSAMVGGTKDECVIPQFDIESRNQHALTVAITRTLCCNCHLKTNALSERPGRFREIYA